MSETSRAKLAVHAALKNIDEYHCDYDLRLIQVTGDRWYRAGTFGIDEGTIAWEPATDSWAVNFEDDDGVTGLTVQIREDEL